MSPKILGEYTIPKKFQVQSSSILSLHPNPALGLPRPELLQRRLRKSRLGSGSGGRSLATDFGIGFQEVLALGL